MTHMDLAIPFNDTAQLLQYSRRGIQFGIFQQIVTSSSFTMKQWSRFLHLTERTLQRYKKEKKKFETLYSDKILEIAQLQKKGTLLFGSTDLFKEWLNLSSIALGGERPIDLLDTSFGIDLVNEELGRIEHGILS